MAGYGGAVLFGPGEMRALWAPCLGVLVTAEQRLLSAVKTRLQSTWSMTE